MTTCKKDVPCAGGCGGFVWRGKGCLPPGRATCRPCRRGSSHAPNATCAHCEKPFRSSGAHHVRCSRACDMANRRANRVPSPRPACEICGAEYRPTYQAQRTCGRTCGARLNSRVVLVRIPLAQPAVLCSWACAICGSMALSVERRVLCGSPACAIEQKRARDRAYNATRPGAHRRADEVCAVCAKPKPPRNHKFCNDCKAEGEREMRRRHHRLRRARERGAKSEPYTLAEIAARDKYTCGICRKRVPMDKAVPHPKAPTIDHLLPLSDEGDDVRANVQLAHFICNSVRGAGGTVQLALVG